MKKLKYIFILLLNLIVISNLYAWGSLGHYIISENAADHLSDTYLKTFFSNNLEKFKQKSVEPDWRKSEDINEAPRHFADLEYYENYKDTQIISFLSLEKLPKWLEKKKDIGLLPWAIKDTYKKLIKAFKQNNYDSIIHYAGYLAHYVGDASQPLHTTSNYDGQKTGNEGIHSRFETDLFARTYNKINYADYITETVKKNDFDTIIWNFIIDSHNQIPIILKADRQAFYEPGVYDKYYYKKLYLYCGNVIEEQVNKASKLLSDLITSAYIYSKEEKK